LKPGFNPDPFQQIVKKEDLGGQPYQPELCGRWHVNAVAGAGQVIFRVSTLLQETEDRFAALTESDKRASHVA